ncbi:PEP-CTERM sorting domain-containing protein [Desulfohalovibrio reitneri]|uniref:PEP-CTERM sorting domain-containing protein n=1 Tax=Desulfohalovibrio reitneri TaxID=1307759 RepID=UPI0004A736CF|nr:PEP-CTERM sorting domain-containing protein [Desulfohalovibrio reitneri]
MYRLPLLLTLALLLGSPLPAHGFVFSDSVVHWPGYASPLSGQNARDVNGTPDLLGGEFVFNGQHLLGIRVDYSAPSTALWDTVVPGDWFLDVDSDGYWDVALANALSREAGSRNVYGVNLAYGDAGSYAFSDDVYNALGGLERKGHPVLATLEQAGLIGSAAFSGWEKDPVLADTYSAYWDVSGISGLLGLSPGGTLTYGFTMNCANDALHGQGPVPAPEPGSQALLLAGGAGVVWKARRKRRG